MDRPPYEAAVRFYGIAEVHWPALSFTFKEVDLLSQTPVTFCTLIHGWVLDRIATNNKDAETDIAQWEFTMTEPLAWQSERQPKHSVQAERDAFLALDEIETY